MACDGLFDVFSSQEAIDFIFARLTAMLQTEQHPRRAFQEIVHEATHEPAVSRSCHSGTRHT